MNVSILLSLSSLFFFSLLSLDTLSLFSLPMMFSPLSFFSPPSLDILSTNTIHFHVLFPPHIVLQPVLQWGSSAAGGGNNWAYSSWCVLVHETMHPLQSPLPSGVIPLLREEATAAAAAFLILLLSPFSPLFFPLPRSLLSLFYNLP